MPALKVISSGIQFAEPARVISHSAQPGGQNVEKGPDPGKQKYR
jgi:hypothetical protein